MPNSVVVDATASEAPAAAYLDWMQRGLHIITPNKKLNSGPLQRYLALRQFQRESYIHFFYEVPSFPPLALVSTGRTLPSVAFLRLALAFAAPSSIYVPPQWAWRRATLARPRRM